MLAFQVVRTSLSPSPDAPSVPFLLSVISDVFAAFCAAVAVLAGFVALHPILLVGIILGFLGLAVTLFRRVFRP